MLIQLILITMNNILFELETIIPHTNQGVSHNNKYTTQEKQHQTKNMKI